MNILLDTNVIISHPEILGLQVPDANLIVLESTMVELGTLADQTGHRLLDLVRKARDSRNIMIVGVGTGGEASGIPTASRLSQADVHLLAFASTERDTGGILIATDDRDIEDAAHDLGIEAVTASELESMLRDQSAKETSLSSELASYKKNVRVYLWASFISGVLATAVLIALFRNIQLVLSTINVWGTILVLLILPFALFAIRERWLLPYALAEIGAGFSTALLATPNQFDYTQFPLSAIVPLFGGIYVMVRGISNFDRAIQGFSFSSKWNRIVRRK